MSLSKQSIVKINIFLLLIIGVVGGYLDRNVHIDDALIYYRYIDNFINGHGLVYNIGEKFNGLTSPLYIYISILISSITKEVELTQICLSTFFLIASATLIVLIFYKQDNVFLGFISSVIFISSKYFYMVFGLETTLFIFLSLLCIYLFIQKKYLALAVFSAFLLLTRGEGIFLLFVLLYFNYTSDKNLFKFYYLVPIFVVFILQILFNYFYYHQVLPHTLFAKIGQGESGLWGKYDIVINLQYLMDMGFNKEGFYIFFIVVLFFLGIANFHNNVFIKILAFYTTLITFFYLLINVPNYHWYYSIHFLTFFILVSCGVYNIFLLLRNDSKWNLIYKLISILIFFYLTSVQIQNFRSLKLQVPAAHYKQISEWLNQHTPENSKIACVEIGHIGWYTHRYIIDILGLVNPHNAEYLGNKEFDRWYYEYKPDYVVIHNPPWVPGHEQTILNLENKGLFKEDTTFNMHGFKILKSTNIN